MQQKMFSIYDSKAETFNTPFFSPTHGEAERNFKTAVNDDKTIMNKYPTDFKLYYLGVYDTNSGKMTTGDSPEHIIDAIQVLNKEQ